MKIAPALSLIAIALFFARQSAQAKPAIENWRGICARCHGPDGKGKTPIARQFGINDLSSPAWQKATTDEQIKQTIQNGRKGLKSGQMDSFATKLTAEEIADLVKYVRTLQQP